MIVTLDQSSFAKHAYEAWQLVAKGIAKKRKVAAKRLSHYLENEKNPEEERQQQLEADVTDLDKSNAVVTKFIAKSVARLYPLPGVGDKVWIKIESWTEYAHGQIIEVMPRKKYMVRMLEDGLVKRARFGEMDRWRITYAPKEEKEEALAAQAAAEAAARAAAQTGAMGGGGGDDDDAYGGGGGGGDEGGEGDEDGEDGEDGLAADEGKVEGEGVEDA